MKSTEIREVYYYLDSFSKKLVGECLKRLDILTDEKLELTNKQIHSLYKSITKESIYENIRAIKKLIEANNSSEKIISKSKD